MLLISVLGHSPNYQATQLNAQEARELSSRYSRPFQGKPYLGWSSQEFTFGAKGFLGLHLDLRFRRVAAVKQTKLGGPVKRNGSCRWVPFSQCV